MRALVKRCQDEAVLPRSGVVGPKLMAALRRADSFDAYGKQLLEQYAAGHPARATPDLGPVTPGGVTVLAHDLTHATGGLDGYPAFDDAFSAGVLVIAPEPLKITAHGSTRRRDGQPNGRSVSATGDSGIRYWFGHIEQPEATGSRVAKGGRIAVVSGNHEEPHLHLGIDARPLTGFEFEHHTDYTHGAATVGAQLHEWEMRA